MFGVLFRKELLESWRSYRLLMLAVVLVAFGILSPVAARFMPEIFRLAAGEQVEMESFLALIPEPAAVDAVDQYLKNLVQMGFLVLVLLAMGLVAGEKDKGTAVLVLARPVSRAAFVLAKFAAFVALLLVCLAAGGLVCYLYTGLLFGVWLAPAAYLAVNGLLLLYLLVPTALTFLGSALTRSSLAAAGIGVLGWIVVGLLGALRALRDWMPASLPAAAAELVRGPAV